MSTRIWRKPTDIAEMNARAEGTAVGHLGITMTEIGPDFLRAEMPVEARHVQPFRLLHGGVSVVLSETLGSLGCYLTLPEGQRCVGIEVNANHLASVPEGDRVTAECRPIHQGRSIHVWQTEIRRSDGRLACVSRLTCSVLEG
ncbi:hotdog fold thioesterase [Roseomonas sp. CCTCC AB2023176]|uniref:hotdog fold thioesterase n=1 Tax=Roseomonas sp. CCTCC AB2023176 TaxID=3342640 RepID=UPI0035DA8855